MAASAAHAQAMPANTARRSPRTRAAGPGSSACTTVWQMPKAPSDRPIHVPFQWNASAPPQRPADAVGLAGGGEEEEGQHEGRPVVRRHRLAQRPQRVQRGPVDPAAPGCARLRQQLAGEDEVDAGQHGRGHERQPDPVIAEQAPEHRPEDEPRAEHRVEQPEAARAGVLGRDVGEVRGGDRQVGAGQPRDGPPQQQEREVRRTRQQPVVDGGPGQRQQHHGPPSQPVAQRAQDRRTDELHGGVQRGHQPDEGCHVRGRGHVAHERGEDGKDEADAHGVEGDAEVDDGERAVHGERSGGVRRRSGETLAGRPEGLGGVCAGEAPVFREVLVTDATRPGTPAGGRWRVRCHGGPQPRG